MRKTKKARLIRASFQTLFIQVVLGIFVAAGVYAATTIGNNVNTGGTLDVTGLSTMSSVTSTSATSTAYLYVGFDITEPTGWNFAGGDFIVSGVSFFNGMATSSTAFWVGSGGTATNINLAGGDLFVQDGAEIDGTLFFNTATGSSATSTAYLYVGFDITEPAGWDFAGGDLLVSGNAFFNSQATSSVSLWIGSGGTANFLNLAGGDLFVQDAVQIGGALTVGGTASSTALVVGGTATSTNLTIGERAAANATTTLTLGDLVAEAATCIKMRTTAGEWVYAYATSASAMTSVTFGLQFTSTSCE